MIECKYNCKECQQLKDISDRVPPQSSIKYKCLKYVEFMTQSEIEKDVKRFMTVPTEELPNYKISRRTDRNGLPIPII